VRGRKPKPSHLRLITGNPGRRPINLHEPQPKTGRPTPPIALNEPGRREWVRVVRRLSQAGLVTPIDRAALAAYCQAYGDWIMARRAIETNAAADPVNHGLLIETSNGNLIQHPLIGIANKARSDMVRFAAEFGMTPSARSRVHANPDEGAKAQDPARKYF
jgi:P27 family predicted phage terminase small subunit